MNVINYSTGELYGKKEKWGKRNLTAWLKSGALTLSHSNDDGDWYRDAGLGVYLVPNKDNGKKK